MTTTTYGVEGMTCQHCVNAVTEELTRLPGVSSVEIALVTDGTSSVTVASEIPLADDDVRAAVDEAGYTLTASPPR